MNKTLTAWMSVLQWQCNEAEQKRLALNEQMIEMAQRLQDIGASIQNASLPSKIILPERNMAAFHFITAQRQREDALKAKKMALLSEQNQLHAKTIRLKTELKMLEKKEKQLLNRKQQAYRLIEQNHTDEWIVQRRKPG